MNKEFLKMQKIAGLITESQFKQLVENDSIDIDTEYNEVVLNSDSGEYTSGIEEDGSLTFELIFDDEGDIAYMNDKDIWDDFAPEVFKKIANAGGDWYVDGDTVGVNTTLDKLKELFSSENSINENEDEDNDPNSFDVNNDWNKIKVLGVENDHQGTWIVFADPEDPYLEEEEYSFAIMKKYIDQVANGERIGVEDGSNISHYMTVQDAKNVLSNL